MYTQDKKHMLDAVMFTAFFLLAIWTVYLMDTEWGFNLRPHGVHPRRASGLMGIFYHPFLHGGLEHIWHNTLSFAVLNTFVFYFYRNVALKTFGIIFLLTGSLLWLIGGAGNHIGASGIVYGLASFLFTTGIIRRTQRSIRIAFFVVFSYGSFFWYMFPIDNTISWEGHLSGAIAGALCAVLFKEAGPIRRRYNWEIHEELEEMQLALDEVDVKRSPILPGYGLLDAQAKLAQGADAPRVVYHFRGKEGGHWE